MRTLKEERVWINEWNNSTTFFKELDLWIDKYNSSYLHSALGYKAPQQFEKEIGSAETLLKTAC